MNQMYAGIALFVVFLLIDIIMYSFKAAIQNSNESEMKLFRNISQFDDTLDIVVFITNLISGAYILGVIRRIISKEINSESIWISVVIAVVMLFVFIIFGVLIPKKCGKRGGERTAKRLSGIVNFIIIIFIPITFIGTLISNLILRIFGINPNENNDNVTEEEIITMVNEGQEQGVLEASEAEMITNIFELGDKNAGDIMTHRSSIVAIDSSMTLEEIIQSQKDGRYSRFPVYEDEIDNIIGMLHIRDALLLYSNVANRRKPISRLKGLMREAFFVPETRSIDEILREMQAEKVHMGIVVDEYGQIAGLISMEDIIEEIVGNILDEYDEETEIELISEDNYVVDGLTKLEELDKLLGVEIRDEEFDTLNGFLISRLKRLPKENESEIITDCGYDFKILEVSQNVVRKVEIIKIKENVAEETKNGSNSEIKE